MKNKIYPRNLTAHLSHNVAGNPAVSRLESSVANCFPGLEMDVRALDRRFFPGLLFDYVGGPDSGEPQHNQQGLKLLYVNTSQDPMLPESATEQWQQILLNQYNGAVGDVLDDSGWYLHSLEQGGNRIEMYQYAYFENSTQKVPYEAETVWWLVRGLSPDEMVTIELVKRDDTGAIVSPPVVLSGYRRRYLNEDGSLNEIFQPGEMTESMCSPWTHDFRDCACHYWAASHPDVVLGEVTENTPLPGGDSTDPTTATTYLDWLRTDRGPSGESEAAPTITVQRPLRIDHYEINHRWEELAFVLEGREIGEVAPGPGSPILARPYDSIEEMIYALENELAPLELTLAVQYLYALYSLRTKDEIPTDRWPSLGDDLGMTRQFIMLVAAGEMQHMRWVNHLLWELYKVVGRGGEYEPIIRISEQIPDGSRPTLARLEPDVLARFINYEHPQGEIFRGYARCVATLHKNNSDLPPHLYELAVRIDTDGIDHYTRFREIQHTLTAYNDAGDYPYLRPIRQGHAGEAKRALKCYRAIIKQLTRAYLTEAHGNAAKSQPHIDKARVAMQTLNLEAEQLARDGIGIPFFAEY